MDNKTAKLTLLSGGHSSVNVLIELPDARYVLRHREKASKEWFQRELFAMQEAAKLGIGPIIFHSLPNDRLILMEYVSPNDWSIQQAHREENCMRVAVALRKVHSMDKNPFLGPSRNEIMEDFYSELLPVSEIQENTALAIAIIRRGNRELAGISSSRSVNTHNDLNPGNILLKNDNILFIDWEGTNYEDPFYDLCYFAIFHNYTQELEHLLICSYLGREASVEELVRYAIAKRTTFARIALSCYIIAARSKTDPWEPSASLEDLETYVAMLAEGRYEGLSSSEFFYRFARAALLRLLI